MKYCKIYLIISKIWHGELVPFYHHKNNLQDCLLTMLNISYQLHKHGLIQNWCQLLQQEKYSLSLGYEWIVYNVHHQNDIRKCQSPRSQLHCSFTNWSHNLFSQKKLFNKILEPPSISFFSLWKWKYLDSHFPWKVLHHVSVSLCDPESWNPVP